MPAQLARPVASPGPLPLFSVEGHRLTRFRPPFRFTGLFGPEDTLLCVLAAETALVRTLAARDASAPGPRIVELTTGSGLVGFRMLDAAADATLLGVDSDPLALEIAAANAAVLGLAERSRFVRASDWDGRGGSEDELARAIGGERVDLLVCAPPCVPEPPGGVAWGTGAGPDGTEHVRRALRLAERLRPDALALSSCSLSDPVGLVREAERIGYELETVYVVAVPDGEHAGSVHEYLRSLPTAYLSENPDTVATIAPDGGARFAYLLMAGAYRARDEARARDGGGDADRSFGVCAAERASHALERLMEDFALRGLPALEAPAMPCPISCWLLDRWDEVALRVVVHGPLAGPRVGRPASNGGGR